MTELFWSRPWTNSQWSCRKAMTGLRDAVPLGYTMVTLHSDKEPAICWVRDKVQANLTERGMSVLTRASPTHSHESNGGAERAIQSVRGLARTLVTQVEHSTGLTFGADSPLWLWAFRHAGWILTRFGRRRDTGMTAYAKLFCKQYRQPLLMFAEAVIARRPGTGQQTRASMVRRPVNRQCRLQRQSRAPLPTPVFPLLHRLQLQALRTGTLR